MSTIDAQSLTADGDATPRPRLLAVETQPHESPELDDFERARLLAERHRLPLVDLAVTGVSPEAVKLVPLRVLERVVAVPYAVDETSLRVALTDPDNIHGIDELRLAARRPVEFAVAPVEDVQLEIRRLLRANEAFGAILDNGAFEVIEEDAPDDLEADDGISDGPVVRLVNSIIFQAAEDGASDVHFEPQEDALVVRFRIDGVLNIAQRIPRQFAAGVTTRVKVLAKLDIAERRKPQDGRITLGAAAAGRTLDIRVATLPTVEGESVVMRLLDKSRRAPTLHELGFSEPMRADFQKVVAKPTGALLVTGPTGSGKSTTLYAALAEINRPEINVITVEDPVEYRLTGINQVQINNRAGLTFSAVLRSILRSDPDVVMVGEVRDVETAKISIEAALTGHFVLSTLHTNDAPGALTRLTEMGVEPFLTSSAVSAVLAQRLARTLCTHCAEGYRPTEEELVAARVAPEHMDRFLAAELRHKVGCARCGNTGYKGRIGVFQFLPMTETVARLASRGATHDEIDEAATADGMRTLWADGLEKVLAGITTFEELARVVV
ncbi:MAG TPA: GspE/PulE family protein [Gaiellaceae bacterium]|nr:GspE/PulE family protein [Gaiellaceae bacterium]